MVSEKKTQSSSVTPIDGAMANLIVQSSKEGLLVIDHDLKYVLWNPEMELISGMKKEQILGTVCYETFPFLEETGELGFIREALEGGSVVLQDREFEAPETKETIFFESSYSPIYDPSENIIGCLGIIRNVTERKKLENELRLLKEKAEAQSFAKGQFLADMSHEIRTPLTGIVGVASILSQEMYGEDNDRFVEILSSSADTLLKTVDNILDLSKIESGKVTLKVDEFSFDEWLNKIVDLARVKAMAKKIDLSVRVDSSFPQTMKADSVRLGQVVSNLLDNAIKYTETGTVLLKALVVGEGEEARVRIEVQDTGVGIPEAKLQYIFEAFSQTESLTHLQVRSTGLGLSICKRTIDMMGGKLGVESQINVGSSFWFELPMRSLEENDSMENKRSFTQTDFVKGKKFDDSHNPILIVEDNHHSQELIKYIIKGLGYEAKIVSSGQEALQKMEEEQFALVLMDLELPDISGLDVTKKILAEGSENPNRRTPIIALTAHVLKGVKEQCEEAGMSGYLSKPFKKEDLQDVFLKWVS